MLPALRFATVAVMAPARSEARKAAESATSARVGSRLSSAPSSRIAWNWAEVHAPRRGGRGDEVRVGVEGDWAGEVAGGQLGDGGAIGRGTRTDGVERDVQASGSLDHGVEVLVHGLRVKSIHVCRLGGTARRDDVIGDGIRLRRVASRQKEPGALACKGPGYGSANRACGSIVTAILSSSSMSVRTTGGGMNGTALSRGAARLRSGPRSRFR